MNNSKDSLEKFEGEIVQLRTFCERENILFMMLESPKNRVISNWKLDGINNLINRIVPFLIKMGYDSSDVCYN